MSRKWDNDQQQLRQRHGTETKRTRKIKKQFGKIMKQKEEILQKKNNKKEMFTYRKD